MFQDCLSTDQMEQRWASLGLQSLELATCSMGMADVQREHVGEKFMIQISIILRFGIKNGS